MTYLHGLAFYTLTGSEFTDQFSDTEIIFIIKEK